MKRGNYLAAACATALLAAAVTAKDAQPVNVSGFAAELSTLRDACADKAKEASQAYSSAQFQASLDAQTAVDQAEMDARVYGVGHGRRETSEFLASRLQENQLKAVDKAGEISNKLASDAKDVAACVSDAEQKGKSLYASYKSGLKHKKGAEEAESLVTAWLTNLKEIDTDHPNGSEATDAAWKTAKSHAEISDI